MTIIDAIKDLNYQSESDSPWYLFNSPARKVALTCANIKSLTGKPADSFCEELDVTEFFDHCVATQPQGKRYTVLRETLDANLTDLHVFKLIGSGDYNLSIYAVGYNINNSIQGVMTFAVET